MVDPWAWHGNGELAHSGGEVMDHQPPTAPSSDHCEL
jgi:hypothetical protein